MIRQKAKLTKKQRSVLNFIRTELNKIRSYKTFDEYCDAVIHVKKEDDPVFYTVLRKLNSYPYDLAMTGKYNFLLFPRDSMTLTALCSKGFINIHPNYSNAKTHVIVSLREK